MLRLEPELKAAIEKFAEAEHRTMANMIRAMLWGALPPAKPRKRQKL